MLRSVQDLIRRGWTSFRFRRHWPWLLLAMGLPLALPPVGSGCAGAIAWVGGLVLAFRALRWIWEPLVADAAGLRNVDPQTHLPVAKALAVAPDEIRQKIARKDRQFVYLKRQISPDQAANA